MHVCLLLKCCDALTAPELPHSLSLSHCHSLIWTRIVDLSYSSPSHPPCLSPIFPLFPSTDPSLPLVSAHLHDLRASLTLLVTLPGGTVPGAGDRGRWQRVDRRKGTGERETNGRGTEEKGAQLSAVTSAGLPAVTSGVRGTGSEATVASTGRNGPHSQQESWPQEWPPGDLTGKNQFTRKNGPRDYEYPSSSVRMLAGEEGGGSSAGWEVQSVGVDVTLGDAEFSLLHVIK